MRTVDLLRRETTIHGTIGVLRIDGECFCWTMERPWALNQPRVSSIPAGQYLAQRHLSPSKGLTFLVTGVPGRDHILFHAGNTIVDTEGCILLGSQVGNLRGTSESRAVLNSGAAFKQFMEKMAGASEFRLTITEAY